MPAQIGHCRGPGHATAGVAQKQGCLSRIMFGFLLSGGRVVRVNRLGQSANPVKSFSHHPVKIFIDRCKLLYYASGMKFSDLVAQYGNSDTLIAKKLGVSRQLVGYWRRQKRLSAARQAWIQVQTRGRLRADPRP